MKIYDLARRALQLDGEKDLANLMRHSAVIIDDLKTLPEYSAEHPICQYLAHRIRNIAVTDPDHSFRRAERLVSNLLGVTHDPTSISEEHTWASSGSSDQRRDSGAVRHSPQHERVVFAGKRLRG